mmetsp:Transcript_4667/g.5614  ORF Transcript_4667/g.5614 Transcript_4667/m.5614 type:complete len:178 (-) Transcript_4667:199-732(-)
MMSLHTLLASILLCSSLTDFQQVLAFTTGTSIRAFHRQNYDLTSMKGSQDDYLRILQEAAKSPEAFEKYVNEKQQLESCATNPHADHCGLSDVPGLPNDDVVGSANSAASSTTKAQHDNTNSKPSPKKSAYKPVEEWDAERTEKGIMTREERLQFDAQRQGNRVNQNDILRHHLNSF